MYQTRLLICIPMCQNDITALCFTLSFAANKSSQPLTHWGRVTHIFVGKLTIIGSDNGLSPGRRQAIILTNAGILSIGPLGTNFNEVSIGIKVFSFKKMHFKITSAKWRPFCLGLNVLISICHQPGRELNCQETSRNFVPYDDIHDQINIISYFSRIFRLRHLQLNR